MDPLQTMSEALPSIKDWADLPTILKNTFATYRDTLDKHAQLKRDYSKGVELRKSELLILGNAGALENVDRRLRGLSLIQNDKRQAACLKELDVACEELRQAITEEKSLREQQGLLKNAHQKEQDIIALEEGMNERAENEQLKKEKQELTDGELLILACCRRRNRLVFTLGGAALALLIYTAIAGALPVGIISSALLIVLAGYMYMQEAQSAGNARKFMDDEGAKITGAFKKRLKVARDAKAQKLSSAREEHETAMQDLSASMGRARSVAEKRRQAVLSVFERLALQAKAFAAERDSKTEALIEAEKAIVTARNRWRQFWLSLPPYFRNQWQDEDRGEYETSFWDKPFEQLPNSPPFFVDGILSEAGSEYQDNAGALKIPHLQFFIGSDCYIKINTLRNEDSGKGMLRGLVLQLAAAYMKRAQFTFLVPPGEADIFPMKGEFYEMGLMRDVKASYGSGEMNNNSILDKIIEDIDRIGGKVLRGGTFEAAKAEGRASDERYEFIFVANFPQVQGYDVQAISKLRQIARKGPKTGKYVFLHLAQVLDMPGRDWTWEKFEDGLNFLELNLHRPLAGDFPVVYGGEWLNVSLSELAGVLDALKREKESPALPAIVEAKKETPVPPRQKSRPVPTWEELKGEIWEEKADERVEAVVGFDEENNPLTIWFGSRDGHNCSHGILAGTSGSGKSICCHFFISSLALRYSPDELNFYLIDGKRGTELGLYKELPHTRAIAMKAPPELMRNVLHDLCEEMNRRNDEFTKLPDCQNIEDYWKKSAEGKRRFPRLILLIDEYKGIYDGDDDGSAGANLGLLVKQGRSAGVHVFLVSQGFADLRGGVGITSEQILENIHLRVAMKMAAGAFVKEFGREGQDIIKRSVTTTGKILINDNAGAESYNHLGAVFTVEKDKKPFHAALQPVFEKAKTLGRTEAFVFDGNVPPLFIENRQLGILFGEKKRPDEKRMAEIARKKESEGGFGIGNWYEGMGALLLWAGQKLNLSGHAQIMLARNPHENIFLLGNEQNIAHGMLAAFACAVAVGNARIFISEHSPAGRPWSELLKTCATGLGSVCEVSCAGDESATTGIFDLWIVEIERRAALPDAEKNQAPSWILFLSEADRLNAIMRQRDTYGGYEDTPASKQLDRIAEEGSALGLHLIMTASREQGKLSVFSKSSSSKMECFKHRIAVPGLQDDEYRMFIGESAKPAWRTDPRDEKSACAFYKNMEHPELVKFRPYRSETTHADATSWDKQLLKIAARINAWKGGSNHVNE